MSILDKVFNDEEFDELTNSVVPKKKEINDPEVDKFLEIIRFIKENGREPQKTEGWTNEKKLWARLQGYRNNSERASHVLPYDDLGILKTKKNISENNKEKREDGDDLKSILKNIDMNDDYSDLLDMSRYKRTVRSVDHISRRKKVNDFSKYKTAFDKVYADIASGRRQIKRFSNYDIEENRFYVQNGVMLYVVSISNESFKSDNGKSNARMHVVYENGTENKNLLYQSLASSLYSKDRDGRMVTEIIDDEELQKNFNQEITTGFIYVLQSKSNDYHIKSIKNLYKIGFTRGSIENRIKNASNDVTYLKAPVRIVLSAEIKNVNAQILERTLHHEFSNYLVEFKSDDLKKAKEWFIVPLESIQSKINKIISMLNE